LKAGKTSCALVDGAGRFGVRGASRHDESERYRGGGTDHGKGSGRQQAGHCTAISG
jgi:hypothetical protein